MRDEVLNSEIFDSLRKAKIFFENKRQYDTTKRPYSALGYRPPAPETMIPMDQRAIMRELAIWTTQVRLISGMGGQ